MPVICRLPQKSSGGSVILTGDAIESDVANGKTFYSNDANTKLTGTASGGGMILPVGLNCKPYGAITIPNGVTSLDKYAFFSNAEVTSVVMANTITSMQDSAFESCTNLTSITFSTGLSTISVTAFKTCTGLTSITIPSNITNVSSQAFYGCTGLTTVVINATAITIFGNSLYNCANLEFITLANGFNCALNLTYSTKFSRDTIMGMINAYVNASGKTLTIGATNLAKLSTEDKAVASTKGLTLA